MCGRLALEGVRRTTMVSFLLQRSVSMLKTPLRRNMSGGAHDEAHARELMKKWIMYSKGMVGVVGVMTVVNLGAHLAHEEHEHEHVPYSYLKIRNKPFPWKYDDCAFFDLECNRKAKAAEQALA